MKLDKAFKELEKELDAIEKMGDRQIIYNNIEALERTNNLISDFYVKYANKDGQIALEEFRKYDRGRKLKKRLAEALYVATREDNQLTRQILKDTFKRSYKGTVGVMEKAFQEKQAREVISIKKDYSSSSSVNKKIEGLSWADRNNRNRNKVVREINTKVIKGMENGETYHQVANKLVDALDIKMNDALTIARTEGHRVRSDAKEAALEEIHKAGGTANKKWLSMNDERVRTNHVDMHGQIVGMNEDFQSPSGASGPSPGNLGDPAEDINCRCVMVLTFEEKTMG